VKPLINRPVKPLINLVVTRNGVPVPDQKQGVKDFLAACTAGPKPSDIFMRCTCGSEGFRVSKIDFVCLECGKSYRD
jgi:hypothetical protein